MILSASGRVVFTRDRSAHTIDAKRSTAPSSSSLMTT
jgi:hypothetical protein